MIHDEETQEVMNSIHEEEQYHNKQGYENPNRKKKRPIRMGDYVTYEDKHKDKTGSK